LQFIDDRPLAAFSGSKTLMREFIRQNAAHAECLVSRSALDALIEPGDLVRRGKALRAP